MTLEITRDDAERMGVDRDGVVFAIDIGRQGFEIQLVGLTIHLEDEADAERLAEMIFRRLGR